MLCVLYVVLTITTSISESANILGIFPSPFYSHHSAFQPLWKELSLRGHNVTVITPFPLRDASLTNVTEIDIGFSRDLVFKHHEIPKILATETNVFYLLYYLFSVGRNLTEEQLMYPAVQELLRSNQTFDLLMVEIISQAWYAVSHRFKCPMIGISSIDVSSTMHEAIGNPNHPYLYPDFNLPLNEEHGVIYTIASTALTTLLKTLNRYVSIAWYHGLALKYISKDTPEVERLERNMSAVFVNIMPGISKNRPTVPSYVQLHGLHLKPLGKLPKDLQEYLDSGKNGVIVFSLGSTFQGSLMPQSVITSALDAFREVPYNVLWKFEINNTVPDNVKTVEWLPQQDVLRHPNVKLFITQGGMQSIEEAISYSVPILGLPIFGDQFYNVQRTKELGLGQRLEFRKITKATLKNAILDIMDKHEEYRSRIRKFAALANDQPVKPLDKAVFWVEHVIRHKGFPYLRSPAVDAPFYEYYLLDVIGFIIMFLILIGYCFCTITLYILKFVSICLKK